LSGRKKAILLHFGASKAQAISRGSDGKGDCLEVRKEMVSTSESDISTSKEAQEVQHPGWLKVGVIAAGSALAGGLAAAWWYRKTLRKLRETGETGRNPQFGSQTDNPFDG
jgi:hypothetical protein